jgi:hypothetical protein
MSLAAQHELLDRERRIRAELYYVQYEDEDEDL